MITKKLKRSEELVIEFSEQEMIELGISKGDKFTIEAGDDNSIILKKFVPVEIDLDGYDIETLKRLVSLSIEKDLSVNEIINDLLMDYCIINKKISK